MWSIIAFASVVISTYGQTRFVIDYYTIPDTSDLIGIATGNPTFIQQASPYPLDVCVGYQVSFTISPTIGVFSSYGMYTCNQAGDEVIFFDYGTDSTCSTADGTNDKTISFDDTLAAGTVGTFNCNGINSYVTISQYTIGAEGPGIDGGDICSDDGGSYSNVYYGIAPTTFALNVCVYGEVDGNAGYTSGTCDATGSQTIIYGDDACSVVIGTSDELSASATCCSRLGDATAQGTIYQRQTNCVINDVITNPADPDYYYCSTDPPTREPTPEPTDATDAPTSAPTDEPTAATPAPTEENASEEGKGSMFIVDYVVLLILGMALFVN